jgi:hypothetical protein
MLTIKISGNVVQDVLLVEYSMTLSSSIPLEIIDDFTEAAKCFNVRAYRACVVMCRRAIEELANIKKARGRRIYDKLSDLKQRGMLDEATYNLASGIREFGGYGAHPQRNLLKNVDRGEADIVLKVAERLIKKVYP